MRCSDCRARMEPIHLEPTRGSRIELDVCLKCGALWFDRGELERASRRVVTRRKTTEQIELECPHCHEPLFADQLGDGNWVYGCDKCRGIFVEGDTVRASLQLHPRARRADDLFAELGGTCPRCGQWRPELDRKPPPDARCVACADRDEKQRFHLGPVKVWLDGP